MASNSVVPNKKFCRGESSHIVSLFPEQETPKVVSENAENDLLADTAKTAPYRNSQTTKDIDPRLTLSSPARRRSERLKTKSTSAPWRSAVSCQLEKCCSNRTNTFDNSGGHRSQGGKVKKRKRQMQKVRESSEAVLLDSEFWFDVCVALFLSSDEEDVAESSEDSCIVSQAVGEVVLGGAEAETHSFSSPSSCRRKQVSDHVLDQCRQYWYADPLQSVYMCTACDKHYSSQAVLLRHFTSHLCCLCSMFFADKMRLTDHRYEHKQLALSGPSEGAFSLYAVSHTNRRLFSKNIVRQVKERKFLCKPCDLPFPTSNVLMRHMVSHVCKYCELFHSNKSDLCEHIEKQHVQPFTMNQLDCDILIVNRPVKRGNRTNFSSSRLIVDCSDQVQSHKSEEREESIGGLVADSSGLNSRTVAVESVEATSASSDSPNTDMKPSRESRTGGRTDHNALQPNHFVTEDWDISSNSSMTDISFTSISGQAEAERNPLPTEALSKSDLSAQDQLISSICQDIPLELCPFENKYYVTVAAQPLSSSTCLASGSVGEAQSSGETKPEYGKFVVSATSVPKSK